MKRAWRNQTVENRGADVYHFNAINMFQRIKQSMYYKKYYTHIDQNTLISFLTSHLYLDKEKQYMSKDNVKRSIDIIDSKAIWKFLNEFLMEFCYKY